MKKIISRKKSKRNVKDCVFSNLFGDKKNLIKLYKCLHPEDRDITPEDIDIVTIEKILVDDIYNDLGFVVGKRIIFLIEAQSTWTVNILIRVLLYYAKTLKEYIDERGIDLYTSSKADIPKPEFYVVFTGERKNKPKCIHLSEEFFDGVDIGIEVTVKMLYGEADDIIGEYVAFTKVFNEQRRLHGLHESAVKETIRICKDRNILKEYLEGREKEVIDMMVTLFDEEQIMKAHDNTVFKKGVEQGAIKTIINFVKEGIITMEDAVKRTGMTEEELLRYR